MRHTLSLLLIALSILSCNSGKSEKEVNTADTLVAPPTDTTNRSQTENRMPAKGALETIGDLSLGLVDTKTIEILGQPESKSKNEEWGADGMFHQDWIYKAKGIELNMSGEKNTGTQQVFSITVTTPATLKTPANIGIGSDISEVKTAYAKDIDPSSNDEEIVVGSVYGGIIFHFKNGKVERIFVGAAAE